MDRPVAESPAAPAGDREQAIDPPEPLDRRADRPVDVVLIGEVGGRPYRTRPILDQRICERPRMCLCPRHDEHGCALLCQPPRARRRDPGRSGHDADPILKAARHAETGWRAVIRGDADARGRCGW